MASSQKPRKKYVKKHVSIPVTHLRHEYGLVMHVALNTASMGQFSHKQYERLAQALNVVWGAWLVKPPMDSSAVIVLEGAMRAMNEAGSRGHASGVWELREAEQASIRAGICRVEEVLPTMDVMVLYGSMQRLKIIERADPRSAAYQMQKCIDKAMKTYELEMA